jgi:nucleotide-binding universal stress UspA family protein
MRYQHILAATDFSELGDFAVARALEIALAQNAKLTLVHVLTEPPSPSPLVPRYYDVQTDDERLTAAKLEAASALYDRIPAAIRAGDLTVHCDVRIGDPADEILAAEVHHRPDLIVLSTHGRRGLSRWILGSVAARVLEGARVDVLAARRREAEP